MTTYVRGTAIITLAVRNALQEMARRMDKGDCGGMFTVGLSATGVAPATHFISTGCIPLPVAQGLNNATLLYTRSKAAWEADGDVYPYTQLQVTNNLALCDVSTDNPFVAMTRMGLQQVGNII